MTKKTALRKIRILQQEHPQLSLGKLEDLPEDANGDQLHSAIHLIRENAEDYLRDSVNSILRLIH